jgi:hypothetical protein
MALIGWHRSVGSGNTVSYRDRLFEAVPIRVRFYGAIGSQHERFRSRLYELLNFAFYFRRGPGRNDAMAVHSSHERAFEAAADLVYGNAPVQQFDVAIDNVAGVIVIRSIVGIRGDVITNVKNVERTGACRFSHRYKIEGLYVTVEDD